MQISRLGPRIYKSRAVVDDSSSEVEFISSTFSNPELTIDYQAESVEVQVLRLVDNLLGFILTDFQPMAVDDAPTNGRHASPAPARGSARGRGGRGRADARVSFLSLLLLAFF